MPEFSWIPDNTLWRKVGRLTSRAVLISVFLSVVLAPSWAPALAQEPTGLRLERAHISVWPEYDDPRVLILYEGTFADNGGFPRVVEFLVPLGIDVNQAAGVTPDGRYLRQTYQIVSTVYYVAGQGQEHTYFRSGAAVVWVAVDGIAAQDVVHETLQRFP